VQHDIQTDKQQRLDEAAPVELTADLTLAPTPTATGTRRKSKARRDLRTTIAQIDNLFPALADKPSKQADLLCEKASAIKTLLALEAEDRQTEQDIRVKELEQQHATDANTIAELKKQNRELQVTASTRQVVTVPDPDHAAVKEERDLLHRVITSIVASMSEEDRAGVAVKGLMSTANVAAGQSLCKLLKIDHWNLRGYLAYTESDLRRLQTARDSNGVLVRAILAEKFPPPKVEAPVSETRGQRKQN
jgi:hypothetical protein